MRITKGADNVSSYHKTDNSVRKWCKVCGGHLLTDHPQWKRVRKWCKVCGGHLLTDHPQWKLVDVYAAIIPGVPFKPGLHVNYQNTLLPMKDGLPKQRDFPVELGGSGQLIAE